MPLPIDFAEAATDSQLYWCMNVEGIAVGSVLVADGSARYRRETRANDPSSTGAVLGLNGGQRFDVPTRVRVHGVIVDCAGERRARPMLSSYCESFNGRAIRVTHVVDLGPADFVRLRPGEATSDLGNLSPLPEGDSRRQMQTAAARFLGAIRSGDRTALATMHGGGPGGQRARGDLERVLAIMLESPDSPFADLRTRSAVTTEIFGWKPPLWADDAWRSETARIGAADAIACFSARADAATLWPIDSKDADNIPGRPYACTRIHIASTGADAPASFDTDQARSGVAEPAH